MKGKVKKQRKDNAKQVDKPICLMDNYNNCMMLAEVANKMECAKENKTVSYNQQPEPWRQPVPTAEAPHQAKKTKL